MINLCGGVVFNIKNNISLDVNTIQINQSKILRTIFSVYNTTSNESYIVGLTAIYRPQWRSVIHYLNDLENYSTKIENLNFDLLIRKEKNNSNTNNYLNILKQYRFFSCIIVSTDLKTANNHIFIRTPYKVLKIIEITLLVYISFTEIN